MMAYAQEFSAWASKNPDYALVGLALLGFAEACPGIGLFVSGAVLLSLASVIYVQGLLTLPEIVLAAMVGAFLADQFGFHLGRSFGDRLLQSRWAQTKAVAVSRAQNFLIRFGAYAVLLGRLLTMIRSLVPMLMGVSGFSPWTFLWLDLLACSIWGAGLAGLVLGAEALFG